MNRDEKNMQTRQKIIDSALREFGAKSYSEASLNNICSDGKISKGIIYHYFKDKDDLYITCLKECFDALIVYLTKHVAIDGVGVDAGLQQYFDSRTDFFAKHPLFLKLFYSAVMIPPQHLTKEIYETKSEFDALNTDILMKLLKNVKLCPDITIEQVVEIFREYQDFVRARYQIINLNEITLGENEKRYSYVLRILLYGVVDRKESKNE